MQIRTDIPSCSEALPLITAELRRARRYERSLCAVVLSPEHDPDAGSGSRRRVSLLSDVDAAPPLFRRFASRVREALLGAPLLGRAISRSSANGEVDGHAARLHGFSPSAREEYEGRFALLGGLLRELLRETDILVLAPKPLTYAIFLTETDREGAEQAIDRYRRVGREQGHMEIRQGCAEFPTDGFTADDLLKVAIRAWEQSGLTPSEASPEPRQSHG